MTNLPSVATWRNTAKQAQNLFVELRNPLLSPTELRALNREISVTKLAIDGLSIRCRRVLAREIAPTNLLEQFRLAAGIGLGCSDEALSVRRGMNPKRQSRISEKLFRDSFTNVRLLLVRPMQRRHGHCSAPADVASESDHAPGEFSREQLAYHAQLLIDAGLVEGTLHYGSYPWPPLPDASTSSGLLGRPRFPRCRAERYGVARCKRKGPEARCSLDIRSAEKRH